VEIERRALDALSRDDFEGMILIPYPRVQGNSDDRWP
jgi:hypothetical protein